MLSERLLSELNKQVQFEFASANLYLAMAAYCASEDFPGFANFFRVQAEEERFHAMKFFDYIIERDGRVAIGGIEAPDNNYSSLLDVFKKGFEHEKTVTKRIYLLSDIAMDEREHATMSLLKWFIDEQVEEESTFNGIIKKLERMGDNPNALFMLDAELAQRVFTPPATA
ncbi:MAG: ferritin [Bacillota bacterium]